MKRRSRSISLVQTPQDVSLLPTRPLTLCPLVFPNHVAKVPWMALESPDNDSEVTGEEVEQTVDPSPLPRPSLSYAVSRGHISTCLAPMSYSRTLPPAGLWLETTAPRPQLKDVPFIEGHMAPSHPQGPTGGLLQSEGLAGPQPEGASSPNSHGNTLVPDPAPILHKSSDHHLASHWDECTAKEQA